MRPVERGPVPQVDGQPKTYLKSTAAISDLEARLGKYCCYCERAFPSMLQVEHLSPKSRDHEGLTDWNNFLLACNICNTIKSRKPTNKDDFLWPDLDNTYRAIVYREGGFVEVNRVDLDEANQLRTRELINLVGLDRHQDHDWPDITGRDRRWEDREKVWKYAELTRGKFPAPSLDDAQYIAAGAAGWGFFSVWMTVFRKVPLVRQNLIQAFLGTAISCFNAQGEPKARLGGKV
jgi:uncharacterized protein (TIGR02646 family)